MAGIADNRLLQSMLLNVGASLNPEGISPGLQQGLQQTIAAQSQAALNERYIDQLRRMLGGEVPDGGKVTMDSKGMKMDLPKSALGDMTMQGTQQGGVWENLAPPLGAKPTNPMKEDTGGSAYNPFRLTSLA